MCASEVRTIVEAAAIRPVPPEAVALSPEDPPSDNDRRVTGTSST